MYCVNESKHLKRNKRLKIFLVRKKKKKKQKKTDQTKRKINTQNCLFEMYSYSYGPGFDSTGKNKLRVDIILICTYS